MSITTDANAVRTLYPAATCYKQQPPFSGKPWLVRPHRMSPTRLGGGDTPGEAWTNALQHPSFKDRVEPQIVSTEPMTDAEIKAVHQEEAANAAPDMVNHPPHYTASESGIECIEAIKAALTPEEFRGFLRGNCLKYLWRCNLKGGIEDVKKAAWYLNRLETSFHEKN